MNDSAPDPFVVCDEHEYYNAIDPCPWCRIAALEQELHDCRLTDAPERTLMGLPISERIWEWWLDDWTGSDREIVLGFCAEVAALEQELEASRFAKRTWREQAELQSARIAALEQERRLLARDVLAYEPELPVALLQRLRALTERENDE